jgi:hypothetical protein
MSIQKGHPIRHAVRTFPSWMKRNETLRFFAKAVSIAMPPQTKPGTRICCFTGVRSLPNIFRITL